MQKPKNKSNEPSEKRSTKDRKRKVQKKAAQPTNKKTNQQMKKSANSAIKQIEKNSTIHLEITALSQDGFGIGRYEGMVIFVTSALPGDFITAKILKIQKNHAFGIVGEIIKPSENRIKNDCKSFPKCGGCKLREFEYKAEADFKLEQVKQNLKKIGGITPSLEGIVRSPLINRYRNKAFFPVQKPQDAPAKVGFFAPRSHRLVSFEDCFLQPKVFIEISDIVCDFIDEKKITTYDENSCTGLIRHIGIRSNCDMSQIMIVIVINGEEIPFCKELLDEFKEKIKGFVTLVLSHNTQNTNVIMGERQTILYGDGKITDQLCGKLFEISPSSFYQINHSTTELLYAKVAQYADIKQGDILLDLYCGIGSIGIAIGSNAGRLIGAEIVPQAVENAKRNAELNKMINAEFICGDAGQVADELFKKGIKPDVLVVDPPRKGLDELALKSIAKMSPQRVVYVSCDSATLSRDIKLLGGCGYTVSKGCVFDMFPRTPHVETVVLMSRIAK